MSKSQESENRKQQPESKKQRQEASQKKPTKRKSGKQEKKIAELEQAVDQLTADLQRTQADFTNFKRRTEQERASIADFGREDMIVKLLPVIDNLERALNHIPKELTDNDWAKGIQSIGKQLSSQLEKIGVTKIPATGQEFNPELHEAIQMEEGEGDKEVVTEELQPGYMLGDNVIRHAMVKVGRR